MAVKLGPRPPLYTSPYVAAFALGASTLLKYGIGSLLPWSSAGPRVMTTHTSEKNCLPEHIYVYVYTPLKRVRDVAQRLPRVTARAFP